MPGLGWKLDDPGIADVMNSIAIHGAIARTPRRCHGRSKGRQADPLDFAHGWGLHRGVAVNMPQFDWNLQESATPPAHVWSRAIGGGRAHVAPRADWQGQMRGVHAKLGCRHVRLHIILSDDTKAQLSLATHMRFGCSPRQRSRLRVANRSISRAEPSVEFVLASTR